LAAALLRDVRRSSVQNEYPWKSSLWRIGRHSYPPDAKHEEETMLRKVPFALLVACGLLLASTATLAEVGGEEGAEKEYLGDLALGKDREEICRFSIKIEEVTFQLNSFHDKYRIVRMRVQNYTDGRVSLSKEKDQIKARDSADRVSATGILDLSREDPMLW